ncbi:serine/threonine-protein kinase [Phyllobacterium sp. YR531]|uniref:serine/threonine protein kinase n=1 Tax=Phyllobacterium sp. YR531 TaxID=1144343 RepID=UPI00026FC42E|nr:serine/threonine-protein kinase [Phyllobacterium sp. YR531]EJM97819.1 protein kinase family protein [Phyllobacterium sp. YR531]
MSQDTGKSAGSIKPGTRLNDIYEITVLLAVGGMSEVYKGHNIQTLDEVAIKVILPHLASDEHVISLFKQEASILNSLGHDAIVRYHVFSIDRATGTAYLTMELVEGPSLYERIKERPLSLAEAAKLISRIASGLKVAHGRGVIHRDISLDNIILSGGNVEGAKLIDFGIARLGIGGDRTLLAGSFAGKYNYVSPEQLGLFGGEVHEPSDIYSLGLVFAAALRGKPIDMSGTHADVVRKRQSIPDLSTIHPAARAIIQRMLQPNPSLRPKKEEIIDALRPMIAASREPTLRRSGNLPGSTPLAGSSQSSPTQGGAGKWIGSLILVLIVAGAGWFAYKNQSLIQSYLTAKAPAPEPTAGKSDFKVDADPGAAPPVPAPPVPSKTAEAHRQEKPADRPMVEAPPKPEQPATPSTEPAQPEQTPAKPNDPPPAVLGELEWVRQFSGGPCFFANSTKTAPEKINIEGFAPRVEPFYEMERAFRSAFNYEPTIHVRQVSAAQCDAVTYLNSANANSGRPKIAMKNEVLGAGDALTATISDVEKNQLYVLLVRDDGEVDIVNTKSGADGNFTLNVKLAAPAKQASIPYMLIAVESDATLEIKAGKDIFKDLEAIRQQNKPIVTVKYLRQQG